MQPNFDKNQTNFKSLFYIWDTMEWPKKPSLATVPWTPVGETLWSKKIFQLFRPSIRHNSINVELKMKKSHQHEVF
jgi:hypothetical protein